MARLQGGRQVVATAGTPVPLSTTSLSVLTVKVQALATNTDEVAVGGSDVDAAEGSENGMVLDADQIVEFGVAEVDELGDIYVEARVDGEGVSFVCSRG